MTIREKIDDFLDDLTNPQFIVIIITMLGMLFLGFYIPHVWSKNHDNPKVEKYGLPIRNSFPFDCEIEICPGVWNYCRDVNDEVIKNIKCDE